MLINLLYPLVNEYSYFLVQCCIKYTVEMSFQNKTLSEYVLQENTTLLIIKVLHDDRRRLLSFVSQKLKR